MKLMAMTTRNARSQTQRGQARAAMEIQRRKVKLQEDHLTALFTHLDGIEAAQTGAGDEVRQLRELGLTLAEISELTGEPVNRLSWLSRLTTTEDENTEGDGGTEGQGADSVEATVDENASETGEVPTADDGDPTGSTVD